MNKLIRITTVPISLEKLLEGQLCFMSKFYDVTAVSSDEKRLLAYGENNGVKTFCLEMTRAITPIKDLKSLLRLYKFLKKEKPLIVHTHTPKAGIVGMLAARMANIPIRLHTIAGLPLLETHGTKRKVLIAVEKFTYACATKVYPNSFRIYEFLLKGNYTSVRKLKVLRKGSSNGIDTSHFDPSNYSKDKNKAFKASINIPDQDMVFIFIGRLVGDKGINELVIAFELLHREFPNISLLLVGPFEVELDPLRRRTMETIKTHPKIFDVGYQNDVRPFLAFADVLTFPSYREGFPNVVMQAGAMGLPSIVTNINGCNEIIQEGINGIIVPVRDEVRLMDAMKEMVTNENYRKRLIQNSRKIIQENYERLEMWKALLAEYKNLELELIDT